jgi:putative transposase
MAEMGFDVETENTRYVLIKDFNRGRFFYEKTDYHRFICSLRTRINQYGCLLHAYALMPDHMHFLVSAIQGLHQVKMLKHLQRDYSDYFNFTHRRTLRKLDPDYSILDLDPDHQFLMYSRYIELAPVRLRLVEHPADYPWTSFGYNAMGEDTGLLSPHPSYLRLGADDAARRQNYRNLFQTYMPASEPVFENIQY